MGLFNSSKAGFGTRAEAEGLTRGLLVDLIYREFVRQLESETTEDQMLFPASYTIYLSSTDFEKRKSGFPFTVKELVNRFNKEIRRRKRAKYPDYVAHSQFWFFKFCAFPEGGLVVVDGKAHESLPEGKVLIQCQLIPEKDIKDLNLPSSTSGKRVVTTIVNPAPMVNTSAINPQAIKGVTTKPGYAYVVEFANFEDVSNDSFSEPVKPVLTGPVGKLEVLDGPGFLMADGSEATTVNISSKEFYICGKNDAASIGGITVLRLNTDEVVSTHVMVRCEPSGTFKVKANGPAIAGGIRLKPGSGESAEIRRGDQIIIGDDIVIEVR